MNNSKPTVILKSRLEQSEKSNQQKFVTPKVTLTEQEKAQLLELKKFMSRQAKNVLQWNNLRRIAKKIYSMKIINCLDGSGYINQVLKHTKK